MKRLTKSEVERDYPKAYDKIPETWKDELGFFIDRNGNLCAVDDDLSEYLWLPVKKCWTRIG